MFNRLAIGGRLQLGSWLLFAFLTALGVLMLAPLVYLASTAFKPEAELFLFPPRFWVMYPTWENFTELLFVTESSLVPFTRYIFNSIVVSGGIVALGVFFSTMCAFPLSKHRSLPLRKPIFSMIILALMFAPQVTQIPQYLVISHLGFMNTYWGLILPGIASPLGLFLTKQFLDQMPDVLLEAARIDGASEWRMYVSIVLPMLRPAIATFALFSFIAAWNDPWAASVYTTEEQMKTLPFAIQTISGGIGVIAREGTLAAASFLMIIPTLLVFVITQRMVMETMAHSGIK